VIAVTRGEVDLQRMIAPEDAKHEAFSVPEDARFTTSLTPDAVKAFYRTELPAFGWTPIEEKDAFAPTIRRLFGDAAAGLVFEQRLVRILVDVGAAADGRTPVRLRSWGVAAKMP
jgi:hypothetical protein